VGDDAAGIAMAPGELKTPRAFDDTDNGRGCTDLLFACQQGGAEARGLGHNDESGIARFSTSSEDTALDLSWLGLWSH
jgi:hypothetical protein